MTIQTKHLRRVFVALAFVLAAAPAFPANRDMIQLQTQVQQLQDAVARLQQSNDERMGVLKDLVQQSADSVNRMSANMDTLQRNLQTQQEASSGKMDNITGQIQALNDSLDEMKARMGRLEKLMQDMQNQQQNIATPPADNSGTAAPAMTPPPQQPDPAQAAPAPVSPRRGKPLAGVPMSENTAPLPAPGDNPAPQAAAAPPQPVEDLYKAALGDYMAAKYSLSAGEFADVIRYYPDHPLSGNAFYYLGEIDYRAAKYDDAVKDYDLVLQHFPDSNKVPASRLHKGQALLEMHQNDAGVRELRALIARYPTSPEAMLARSKLSGMGITVTPRRGSANR